MEKNDGKWYNKGVGDVQVSTGSLSSNASSQRDSSVKTIKYTSANSLANRVENAVDSFSAGVKSAVAGLSLNMAVA